MQSEAEMLTRKVLCLCLLAQFLFVTVNTQYGYDCEENFCSKLRSCPQENCKAGSRLIKNATQCGCCHVCVDQLGQKEKCKIQEFGLIPRQECGFGLVCDKKTLTCVPANTQCLKDQMEYDQKLKYGSLLNDRNKPECDEFGFYKSAVCVSDALCYCVHKNGTRIFGTDIASNYEKMNCNCSRDFVEFHRPVPDGNFLRCLPNGNYDPLQCTEKWCYCMGDSFHSVGTMVKANTTLKELLCYDRKRHKDDDPMLRSKCWNERLALQNQQKEYEKKGITVVGLDLPQCDLDGSYAPVQCKKDKCYCVQRNGELYDGSLYKTARNSKEAKDMTCKCIREKEMLSGLKNNEKVKEFFTKYTCDSNGNYKKPY